MTEGRPRRATLALAGLFGAALALRLLFVWWAPRAISGDAHFYHAHAGALALGWGYVHVDGSPGIRWMPGWPAYLSALYRVFGASPTVGMISNAIFGGATSVLVAVLGLRLFGRRVGLSAGWIYALWPGLVYYTATLFTESTFSFLLVATLCLLVAGSCAPARRPLWFAGAGVGLGLCAMVKAEPLALMPALFCFLWSTRRSARELFVSAAALAVATTAVIAPWSVRNYLTFDRVIPTSANGGSVVWLGNHAGARGGNDIRAMSAYAKRHKRETEAESVLAKNSAGWRDAWRFARENPGEELSIVLRKLRLTYRGDSEGALLVRGLGKGNEFLDRATWLRMARVADAWWFGVLALAALGAVAPRAWPRGSRTLLFGVLATWLVVHVVFIGGTRFHVPETPVLALFAGCGVEWLAARWRGASLSG